MNETKVMKTNKRSALQSPRPTQRWFLAAAGMMAVCLSSCVGDEELVGSWLGNDISFVFRENGVAFLRMNDVQYRGQYGVNRAAEPPIVRVDLVSTDGTARRFVATYGFEFLGQDRLRVQRLASDGTVAKNEMGLSSIAVLQRVVREKKDNPTRAVAQ